MNIFPSVLQLFCWKIVFFFSFGNRPKTNTKWSHPHIQLLFMEDLELYCCWCFWLRIIAADFPCIKFEFSRLHFPISTILSVPPPVEFYLHRRQRKSFYWLDSPWIFHEALPPDFAFIFYLRTTPFLGLCYILEKSCEFPRSFPLLMIEILFMKVLDVWTTVLLKISWCYFSWKTLWLCINDFKWILIQDINYVTFLIKFKITKCKDYKFYLYNPFLRMYKLWFSKTSCSVT